MSDLLPDVDDSRIIGSASRRWKGAFLSNELRVLKDSFEAILNASLSEEIEPGWTVAGSFVKLYEPTTNTKTWIMHDAGYPFDLYIKRGVEAGRNPIYYSYDEDKLYIWTTLGIFTIEPEIIRTSPTTFDLLIQSGPAANRSIIFQLWNGSAYFDAIKANYDSGVEIASDITLLDDRFIKIGKDSDGALPTASAAYRGKMIMTEGGTSARDRVYICLKGQGGGYSWVEIANGGA